MKKRVFLATVLSAFALIFAGCNSDNNSSSGGETPIPTRVTTKFLNYDDTVLYVNTIPYGQNAEYKGEIPKKPSNQSFVYTFSGWDKSLENIIEDTNFYAQYSSTKRKYEITFLNYDGEVLETQNLEYGSTPIYGGVTPTKPSDSQYSYSFSGWYPEISIVNGNATYQAQYSSQVNFYEITWVVDGAVTTETYKYGDIPTYKGETQKPNTAQYSYEFTGWSPAVKEVTGDATYTAQYDCSVNKYTITWLNYNGSVISSDKYEYGSHLSIADPSRPNTAQYSYEFTGWIPEMVDVAGDATYTAQYKETVNSYTITWVVDGNITQETYSYGAVPSFKGNTEKESTAEYTYEFTGWSPLVKEVTGDATYTAQYLSTKNSYKVTWKNYDGSVLLTEQYHKGELPVYSGEEPKKQGNAQYSYSFSGWTPEINIVEENAIYTALYDETVNSYTITWVNYDGTVLKTDNYEYGSIPSYSGPAPTKTNTAQYSYVFVGWSDKLNPTIDDVIEEFEAVNQGKTYRAVFEQSLNNVKITYVDQAGNVLGEESIPYGTKPQGITFTENISFQTADGIKYEGPFSRWSIGLNNAYSDETKIAITSKLTVKGYTGTAKDLVIPSSVEGTYVTSIAESAFYNNQTIESVSIPDFVTSIGNHAFQKCLSLKSFSVGANNAIFTVSNDKRSLIKGTTLIGFAPNGDDGYEIPSNVYTIGTYAFSGCDIRYICFPSHYFDVEEGAFSNCSSLIWIENFMEYVHSIGDYAFFNCSSLSGDVMFGNYLTTIGSYIFMNTGIEAVLISSSIRTINSNAFDGSSLQGILMRSTSESGIDLGVNWNGGVDVYWYSSTQKANCWHYTSGGEIELW